MSEPVYEVGGSVDPIEVGGPCDTHPIHWDFAATGIRQEPSADAIYCPDCDRWVEPSLFVEHRELEHPPSSRELQVSGIASQEQVGMPGGGR